jgi:lipid-binding SYLF domain-containing protein
MTEGIRSTRRRPWLPFFEGSLAWRMPGGVFVLALALLSPAARAQPASSGRLHEARMVLQAGLSGADAQIPADLLDRADCVGVFPGVLKVALLIGGQYGRGYVTCRNDETVWSAPSAFRIEGGNFGLQLGGSSNDLILLFLGPNSVNKLLRTKFTVGVDAAAAAGPQGRIMAGRTDALFGAEIISYSRSRGLFAGISLEGATLRPAHGENRNLYGFAPEPRALFRGEIPAPQQTREFLDFLRDESPRKRTNEAAALEPAALPAASGIEP